MAPCYGWRSPHTRGARVQHQPVKAQPRIIPAYAGSTDRPLGRPRPGADHPRIRGEHGQGVEIQRQEGGSSPHTRGAPQDEGYGGEFEGIIPAYAGSTRLSGSDGGRGGDHPRIRGEHPSTPPSPAPPTGSSPHTRGARRRVAAAHYAVRIIPAYAGSTPSAPGTRFSGRDHPRIRGEHVAWCQVAGGVGGSSPHTRGARHHHRHRVSAVGIIPAYAGSTWHGVKSRVG